MADPVVDEQHLMGSLDVPASLAVVERLQSSSVISVIDGFDRKVTRDPFIHLTAAAFSLHTHLGRLHLIARINELFKQGKLTQERLTDAENQLIAFCEVERVTLCNQVALVAQCPTSASPVH